MVFRTAYIAVAPDGDPTRHHATIRTSTFELHVAVVPQGRLEQAVKVCQELARDYDVVAIALCPSFSHEDVGEIKKAVGDRIAVDVARGDIASTRIVLDFLRHSTNSPD